MFAHTCKGFVGLTAVSGKDHRGNIGKFACHIIFAKMFYLRRITLFSQCIVEERRNY